MNLFNVDSMLLELNNQKQKKRKRRKKIEKIVFLVHERAWATTTTRRAIREVEDKRQLSNRFKVKLIN